VLRRLELGRAEDGRPWLLDLTSAIHVLIAGSTGAGKGSILWSLVRLLMPLVRAGLVELWVIDPKGGMEFRPGRPLFARYEDSSHEAMVALLEDAAFAMDERTDRLAGIVRKHVPSREDPYVVVLVDEVADLTAHNPDRALKQRANSALARLLAKGRAPGFSVIAAVVDPRKDVIPFRDLFPARVAMRLAEPEQTDLVLGDTARDRGADCSTISRLLPGVAYVHDDTSTDPAPLRVRFTHITDEHIDELVADHLAWTGQASGPERSAA
jgi:DNA segregation ATPase FtsK/SpoIIIE, S-DNA-T family